MASRTQFLEVTYHDDDDTGIYTVGEIDFGICGTLDNYIARYGYKGKAQIINTLSYLMYEVERRFREGKSPTGGSENVAQTKSGISLKL